MKEETKTKLITWSENNQPLDLFSDKSGFNDFIIEAHKNGDNNVPEEEFYNILVTYSKDEDVLVDLYTKYKAGINLLNNFGIQECK